MELVIAGYLNTHLLPDTDTVTAARRFLTFVAHIISELEAETSIVDHIYIGTW